jgi:inosine-uridine nucleoside N-ribohydrolase
LNRRRIWVDTDPALGFYQEGAPRDVDDAFVIVEAAQNEAVELCGVSTVFGNAPADVGFSIASQLIDATGSRAPVAQGAAGPGDERSGFPGNDAVLALAQALEEGPLSIAAIGPLTNIAALLELHPEHAQRIERVAIVAGRTAGRPFTLHGTSGVPDFNFESDPLACRKLLESGVPVTLVGFELTSQVALTREHLLTLRGRSPVADLLVDGALPWLEWWTNTFPGDPGFHPWDSAALAALLRPELFVHEPRGWRITPHATGPPWLELAPEWQGSHALYCPGFTPGGAQRFIAGILAGVP